MSQILLIVLGAVAWQFITFLVCILTGQKEEATIAVGMGVIGAVTWLILNAVKNMRNAVLRLTTSAFVIKKSDGSIIGDHVRVRKHDIKKYYCEGENQYYLLPSKWRPSSCMSIRRIRKNGWLDQAWVDNNLLKRRDQC